MSSSKQDDLVDFNESDLRLFEKLHRVLGGKIVRLLQDKTVNEIMLNPDGSLWIDSHRIGQMQVGKLTKAQGYSILAAVAGIHEVVVSQDNPSVEATLPIYREMQGERFTGQIPPIVMAPCFTIRKKSELVFTLDDYVKTNRLTLTQSITLSELVSDRKNILICGGPGSGKTTVTNALIATAVAHNKQQRFLLLEDTPELQCSAPNKIDMLTSATSNITMTDLLRLGMRMRPDRILIGEVRGAEALDMLKAWNTGCPGGICTVHANSAEEAVQRILDLALEAGIKTPPISLVLHTIDAIVSVVRKNNEKGFINQIVLLKVMKMANLNLKSLIKNSVFVLALTFFCIANVYASTTGNMPFNTSMDNFKSNFIAVVFVIAVILWVATCLMLAFGDWGDGIKRAVNIVFWLSLALSGSTGMTYLFGSGATF